MFERISARADQGPIEKEAHHGSGLGVSDGERASLALKGIEGKRLTYRRPN